MLDSARLIYRRYGDMIGAGILLVMLGRIWATSFDACVGAYNDATGSTVMLAALLVLAGIVIFLMLATAVLLVIAVTMHRVNVTYKKPVSS